MNRAVLFAGLVIACVSFGTFFALRPAAPGAVIRVEAAASFRGALERLVKDHPTWDGFAIELNYGASGVLLNRVRTRPADLFLPADASYLEPLRRDGLIAEEIPLSTMQAVLLVHPRVDTAAVAEWETLIAGNVSIAQAEPSAAAIGMQTRSTFEKRNAEAWPALLKRTTVTTANVVDAANAVELGSVDAAIVWGPVARNYPRLRAVEFPELTAVRAEITLAILANAPSPDAARSFAHALADPERLGRYFTEAGWQAPTRKP